MGRRLHRAGLSFRLLPGEGRDAEQLGDSAVRAERELRGSSDGQLGGLAALGGGGFAFTFATREGRTSRDVGFIAFDAQLRKSPTVWLTSAAGDESTPHLARYGAQQLLASWRDGADSKLAVVSAAGVIVEGPVTAPVGLAERDDFGRWPGGDVGWAEERGQLAARRAGCARAAREVNILLAVFAVFARFGRLGAVATRRTNKPGGRGNGTEAE